MACIHIYVAVHVSCCAAFRMCAVWFCSHGGDVGERLRLRVAGCGLGVLRHCSFPLLHSIPAPSPPLSTVVGFPESPLPVRPPQRHA